MPEQTIRFTPAQSAAIRARGGSLLVSAAAGSGKTRVLVERVAGLITDPVAPVDADALLIMTFTNAAAAKLRSDIARRLVTEIRARPGDARLRRQQLRLQRADIGTVDAFCLHFVQQNFSALEIPPDFTVADEATLTRLRQETLAQVLEHAYEDADFCAFADLYDRGRTDDTAGRSVQELYDFTQTLPHPSAALRDFAAMWQTDDPPQQTVWGRHLLRAAAGKVDGALQMIRAAQKIAARDDAADKALTAVLFDDEDRLRLLAERLERGDWDRALEALQAAGNWRRMGRIPGGKAGNTAASAAAELRERAKKQVASLAADFLLCTEEEFRQDRRRAAPLVAALVRAVEEYRSHLFQAKLTEKVLDYADLEHLTLELLQTPDGDRTSLCRTVSRRYAAVLVDEYQDTNALQDAIYFSLAAPDASNLFFVGDIKQSIYRFRQADPSVFIGKQLAWKPYPTDAPVPYREPATIALDANFRSAPDVIRGINYLFETIFSAELGGIEYGDGQRLVPGREGEYRGLCELDVLPEADAAGDARTIAERIARMKEQGFAVRGEDGTRPCEYGDFCILLRSRGDFALYEAALASRGIPVYADTADDLLSAPHIRPFAALLRVIDNPAQDVELSAVLLSPLYPYTPDDLVRLRREVPGGSLYTAVLYGGKERFAPFLRDLETYRRLARTLPVDRLIEELFARTGYLAAVGAMPDGEHCRDDLRGFAVWAAQAGARGLAALVRAMDAAQDGGGVQNPSGTGQSRPGCVTIMTVHRSKGLEFPIVFVADTAHKFNQSDAIRPVLSHRELGVGLMLRAGSHAGRYKTLPYAALAQTIRGETLSEEMRILYVALTRAQDALIVTVPLRKPDSDLKMPALCACAEATSAALLRSGSSWASWLLTAALLHPDSGELWKYSDLLPHWQQTDAPLHIRVVPPAEQVEEPPREEPAEPDRTLCAAMLDAFDWHNPEEALHRIPAKVSVSAVAHAQQEILPQRPAFLQKSGMTGAERGTAIHAFMQSVPFDGPAPDLAREVERQIRLRLLDPALAEVLDLEVVRPFFESDLWQRITRAGRILREEPFITALPAGEVVPEQFETAAPDAAARQAPVLVQGIADLVLVFEDHAEIVDYKTDRSTDPSYYKEEYASQLRLYRRAFALRLPVPVTRLTIYAFALHREIDIPCEP
ncbi:MAG: UvrD-helicase domain-containing protein [Gemmiger sp.]|uniref:UvrD-helicase domain-containing protein n=1 Tax=Gemmiger sp. TaxID=2049027 RepID=UPI002E79642A|nr:UvrD-helicase domain-containing protein [Gemmiger sp.]MEE0800267.1 UvrD-helicase domain-containing protein [Gemmiger sp.]